MICLFSIYFFEDNTIFFRDFLTFRKAEAAKITEGVVRKKKIKEEKPHCCFGTLTING